MFNQIYISRYVPFQMNYNIKTYKSNSRLQRILHSLNNINQNCDSKKKRIQNKVLKQIYNKNIMKVIRRI